jgi:hypothetical protein
MESNYMIDYFISLKKYPDFAIDIHRFYSSIPRKERDSFFPIMMDVFKEFNEVYSLEYFKIIEKREKIRLKSKASYQKKKEARRQYEIDHWEEIEKERNERMSAYKKEISDAENRLKMLRYDDIEEYISLCGKYRFDNKDYMICKSHLYMKYKGRKREIDKILNHFIENKWFVECKTQHVKNIYYNLYPGLIIDQLLNDVNDPTKLVNDVWGLANIY